MIKEIALTDFRSLTSLKINTANNLVIIQGNNAVGKTSILEAIYYVSTSKSHRTNNIEALVNEKASFTKIEINNGHKFKSVISQEGKSNYLDGALIPKISDYIGNLNVVMFSPLDINLISGNKSDRRNFLDLQIGILDKKYLQALSAYKKYLNERNMCLKKINNSSDPLLGVYTDELIKYAKIIHQKRILAISKLNEYLLIVAKALKMPEKVILRYEPSVDYTDLEKAFKSKLNYDFLTKMTNAGPHRDDFSFMMDDALAKEYASQGQLRGITIALKFAVRDYISYVTKEKPILLLDDVFNELDNSRQQNLLDYLIDDNQIFITTTSVINLPDSIIEKGLVITLPKREMELNKNGAL